MLISLLLLPSPDPAGYLNNTIFTLTQRIMLISIAIIINIRVRGIYEDNTDDSGR